jgi:hypothetical protein
MCAPQMQDPRIRAQMQICAAATHPDPFHAALHLRAATDPNRSCRRHRAATRLRLAAVAAAAR